MFIKARTAWRRKSLRQRTWRALNILAMAALVLHYGAFVALAPQSAQAASGSIWTTTSSCGSPQNVNQYNVGETVYIHGDGFPLGDYDWAITGLPGQASTDPNIDVASSILAGSKFHVDASGQFCFDAYEIQVGDSGEYQVKFENVKGDNLHIKGDSNDPQGGEDPLYNLHGYKWNDLNGNGQRDCQIFDQAASVVNDSCEPLLGGWTIQLWQNEQKVDEMQTCSLADTQDEKNACFGHEVGWYWFMNLPAGDYTICEVPQAGWTQTFPVDPNCHQVSLPNDLPQTENAVLAPEYNFGNHQDQCRPGASWAETVVDASQGTLKNGNPITDSARTDPNAALGAADFPAAGSFFSLGQNGWITLGFNHPVLDAQGDDLSFHEATNGRNAYPNAYPLESALVQVSQDLSEWKDVGTVTSEPGGDGVMTLDFSGTGYQWIKYVRLSDTTNYALHQSTADGYDLDAVDATYEMCASGSVEGYKWHDRNGNGVLDNGEEPMADVRIQTLHGLFDVTDANGYYRIDAIPVGTESIIEFTPDGWFNTNHNNVAFDVPITANQTTRVDFGNYQKSSISGMKFNDLNGNSQNDEEPGLENWTITLWKWNDYLGQYAEEAQTTTDQNGQYTFSDLVPGKYQVSEEQQAGWTQTFPVGSGLYDDIQPLSGEQLTGYDFGNYQRPQIVTEGAPDLNITKTNDAETFVNPGDTVGYTVAVTNTGLATAYAVSLTDTLPDGFSFVSGSANITPDSTVGQTTSWSLGDIDPNQTVTVTYNATVDDNAAAGTYTNTATASTSVEPQVLEESARGFGELRAATVGPVATPGTQTVSVTASSDVSVHVPRVLGEQANPELTLTKVVDPSVTNPGKTVTYSVVVENIGQADAVNVVIIDTLPGGLTYADTGDQSRTWTYDVLGAGESKILTFPVKVSSSIAAGDYVNTAKLTADNNDPLTASAKLTVKVPQVLGLADTGVGPRDYLIFSFGLLSLMSCFVLLRRQTRA